MEFDRILEHMSNSYKDVKKLYVNKYCYNSENQIIYAKCKVHFSKLFLPYEPSDNWTSAFSFIKVVNISLAYILFHYIQYNLYIYVYYKS